MARIKKRTANSGVGAVGSGENKVPQRKLVPPEGGWGWMVVVAFALNYLMSIPLLQSFGLIFKDLFPRINMSAMDSTTIINVHSALSSGLGLLNGPLLRRFTYRKVAVAGSLFLFMGVFATSFASSFTEFIIGYSVISATGMCFLHGAYNLAMNSYFRKLRGRANGLAMAATGLGPVLIPLLISFLLNVYAVQGTVLIMSGLVLHSLVAALLLQPVKWHMKPVLMEEEERPKEDMERPMETIKENNKESKTEEGESMLFNDSNSGVIQVPKRKRSTMKSAAEHDLDSSSSIYGFDTQLLTPSIVERSYRRGSVASTAEPRSRYPRSVSQEVKRASTYWWDSNDTINLGSSYMIFDEKEQTEGAVKEPTDNNDTVTAKRKKGNCFKRALAAVAEFFYLDMLKDPIYVSIMIGMCLTVCAEVNFSMLTPFILGDYGIDTADAAKVISLIAGVDIVFRFFVPFIAERFNWHPRVMYVSSLILLTSIRTALLFFNSLSSVICIAVFLGIGKGIRTVYMTIIVPTYVPLEKLAGASGLRTLINGLVFTAAGPLFGLIREVSGSYAACIYLINGMTLFTVVIWIIEFCLTRKGLQGML